jgi:type I restriction enzyme, S subunit
MGSSWRCQESVMTFELRTRPGAPDWRRCTIGDVAEVKGGKRLPGGEQLQTTPNGAPYLRTVDLDGDTFQKDRLMFVPASAQPRLDRYRVASGNIFISIVGTVGLVTIVPRELDGAFLTENAAKIVIRQDSADARFMAYMLRSPVGQAEIAKQTVGSTQQKLALFRIKAIPITLPAVCEQRRIADVLTAFDDKIDSNRRFSVLLEKAAATTFGAMFVDFVGQGVVDSPLGSVPKGWSTGVLSDLVDVTMGQSPPGSSYAEDPEHGVPLVQGMGVFGSRYPASNVYTSAPTKLVSSGTTIMTVRAPVGAVNIARTDMCLGRGVAGFASNYHGFTEFLIRSLQGRWEREESGTIYPAVNRKQITGLPIVIPPRKTISEFNEYSMPIVTMLASLDDEGKTLIAIRDVLLPKLVSGEIRVPDTTDPEEVIGPAAEALAEART